MYIQLNDQILFYEKTGMGQPIILLHGNGGSHGDFDVLAADLENEYTVYALDSRGHGLSSEVKEFHYADMANDVIRFIESLHIEKPVVYGYSDGGIVGLMAASMRPELFSKLIVSGANATPSGISFFARREIKKHYRKTNSPLDALMLNEPNITAEDLSRITCPVLVLAGEQDLITAKETNFIADHIKNSTLTIVPGEDHGSYIVHSHKISGLILHFLNPAGYA